MSACKMCDRRRVREGTPWKVGEPCDICAGMRYDFLGRQCRHCAPTGGEG